MPSRDAETAHPVKPRVLASSWAIRAPVKPVAPKITMSYAFIRAPRERGVSQAVSGNGGKAAAAGRRQRLRSGSDFLLIYLPTLLRC